jgi:hypothetical protein
MALPKTPDNFIVIRSEDRESFLLKWNPVAEDVEGNPVVPTGYSIYATEVNNSLMAVETAAPVHNAASAVQYAALHTVKDPVTGNQAAIDPDRFYFFKVAAVSAEGTGAYTDEETDH